MEKDPRPVLHELTMTQIEDLAEQIAHNSDASQIFYFGSRRWDSPVSFGLVEFVIVVPRPSKYTQEVQDEIFEKFSITVDALLTFVESEADVMSRSILVWPLKN